MALYFRLWLLAPLIFALLGYLSEWVPVFALIPFTSFAYVAMLFAGIAYLMFVACALAWSFVKKGDSYKKEFIYSPFVFGLFCFIYFKLLLGFISTGQADGDKTLHISTEIVLVCIVILGLYSVSAVILWYAVKRLKSSD